MGTTVDALHATPGAPGSPAPARAAAAPDPGPAHSRSDHRLPVPVSAFGPMATLSRRVHELAHTGHGHEALAIADDYIAACRIVGDEKTVGFLIQGKMYANLMIGRVPEATALAEQLLHRHRSTGSVLGEAKALSDLAELHFLAGRYVEGMRCLARAGLLLDGPVVRDGRYRSAVASLAEAANAAELYEIAAGAYRRMLRVDAPAALSMSANGSELAYAAVLLYWGLRLHHLGLRHEAEARLRLSAALSRRWVDGFTDRSTQAADPGTAAVLALALAKLGEVEEAEKLARAAVLPLRERDYHWHARMAHLALGISLHARGDLVGARRELVAAEQLCGSATRPDERPVIRHEMALLALRSDGGPASRELFAAVQEQDHELWRMRLQRLGMLRQARQREEVELARQRAEQEIVRDPLTGLGNRRQFDRLLAAIDAGELPAPLVLLLIDVDEFKAVNDRWTHSDGDRVLREIGRILRMHCRSDDTAVRYAGDEFTLFLHTGPEVGREVAERVRAAVAAADILPGVRLSISAGMAEWRPGMTGDELFRIADERLYEAKRAGRNRIAA